MIGLSSWHKTPLARRGKLGQISKMGERTLRRRLLIIGRSAAVLHIAKRCAAKGSWLEQMMARKARMLVTVAGNRAPGCAGAVVFRRPSHKQKGRPAHG